MKPIPYVWIAAGILFVGATVWINYEVKVNLQAASQGGATRELGEIRVGQQAPYFSTQDPAGQTVSSLRTFAATRSLCSISGRRGAPPARWRCPGFSASRTISGDGTSKCSASTRTSPPQRRPIRAEEGLLAARSSRSRIQDRKPIRRPFDPTLVVVDKRGLVQWIRVGYRPDDSDLPRVLERLVKE